MEKVLAFAPANISCVFKPYIKKTARWSGSYGVGFTITEGVTAQVSRAKETKVFLNKKQVVISTVVDALQMLTKEPVEISLKTNLPIGSGFGISGASALATLYAVNNLLHIKKTTKQLAVLAHTAEVNNKTGLGDVTNQFFGGILLKTKPSSYFSIEKIDLKEKYVYCRVFGVLLTKDVLNNKKLLKDIEEKATEQITNIKNALKKKRILSLGGIFSFSKAFVLESGLLKDPQVIKTIHEIEEKGGKASMIILGNAVMSSIPFPGSTQYEISDKGAHLL